MRVKPRGQSETIAKGELRPSVKSKIRCCDAFSLWGKRKVDGLAYQKKLCVANIACALDRPVDVEEADVEKHRKTDADKYCAALRG